MRNSSAPALFPHLHFLFTFAANFLKKQLRGLYTPGLSQVWRHQQCSLDAPKFRYNCEKRSRIHSIFYRVGAFSVHNMERLARERSFKLLDRKFLILSCSSSFEMVIDRFLYFYKYTGITSDVFERKGIYSSGKEQNKSSGFFSSEHCSPLRHCLFSRQKRKTNASVGIFFEALSSPLKC